jgi:hypothetical protein
MLAKVFRIATLVALAVAAWLAPAGPSFQAYGGEGAAPLAPTPANESPAPAALNGGHGAPMAMDYGVSAPGSYNYYVHPGQAGLVGAQLYVSPRPAPPLVGHTYITYPPLMPHEFLYQHHRVYETYNPGSGWTKTRVRWH